MDVSLKVKFIRSFVRSFMCSFIRSSVYSFCLYPEISVEHLLCTGDGRLSLAHSKDGLCCPRAYGPVGEPEVNRQASNKSGCCTGRARVRGWRPGVLQSGGPCLGMLREAAGLSADDCGMRSGGLCRGPAEGGLGQRQTAREDLVGKGR